VEFKGYLLNAANRIVARYDIEAPSADEAARITFDRAVSDNQRTAIGIEIWSDTRRQLRAVPILARMADRFRDRAEEARAISSQMRDPVARASMQAAADRYERLAARAEQLVGSPPGESAAV
jgi:hypothetical protein